MTFASYPAPDTTTPPITNPRTITLTAPQPLDQLLRTMDQIILDASGEFTIGNGTNIPERHNEQYVDVILGPNVEYVAITGTGDSIVPRCNVHFKGVILKFGGKQFDASPGGSAWFEKCEYVGWAWAKPEGETNTPAQPFVQWGENADTPAAKYYVTNSVLHDGFWGAAGCELVDGCTVENVSYGATILSRTVKNTRIKGLNGKSGRTAHRDVFHAYNVTDGFSMTDVVIEDSQAQVFNFEGITRNCTFTRVDASGIVAESNMTNIGLENNWGSTPPSDLYGEMENITWDGCIMPTQPIVIIGTFKNVVVKNCKLHWRNRDWVETQYLTAKIPGFTSEGNTLASLQVNAPSISVSPAGMWLTWTLHRPIRPGITYLTVAIVRDGVKIEQDLNPVTNTQYPLPDGWTALWISQWDSDSGTRTYSDILTPAPIAPPTPAVTPTPPVAPPAPVPPTDPDLTDLEWLAALRKRLGGMPL